jgi:hypothetical protein
MRAASSAAVAGAGAEVTAPASVRFDIGIVAGVRRPRGRGPEVDHHDAVAFRAVLVSARLGVGPILGRDRFGGRLLGLLGGLALAHPAFGFAVGEDLPEVASDCLAAHPLLVAVAKPLLGRRREGQGVGLAGSPDQLHLALLGSDG